MASKLLPIAALGLAGFALMPKKKAASKTKAPSTGGGADGDIVSTGTLMGWKWRVRLVKTLEGFADRFLGEIQAPDSKEWTKAHTDARPSQEAARLLAMEAIATQQGESDISIAAAGDYSDTGWQWRVISTPPPAGFGGDPSTEFYFGETRAPDSDAWIRAHQDGRLTVKEARLLAMEAIALKLQEQG